MFVRCAFRVMVRPDAQEAGPALAVELADLRGELQNEPQLLVNTALAAGGTASIDPMDHGFMYSRSQKEPDGHLWEVLHGDNHGPEVSKRSERTMNRAARPRPPTKEAAK